MWCFVFSLQSFFRLSGGVVARFCAGACWRRSHTKVTYREEIKRRREGGKGPSPPSKMATTHGGKSMMSSASALPVGLKLDESTETLSLLSILRAFDGPVNEERAWAVLYQAAKTALQCFNNSANHSSSSSSHHHHHLHHHNNNDTIQSDNHSSTSLSSTSSVSSSVVSTSTCLVVNETAQLWIHRDGHVHSRSFHASANTTVNEDDEGIYYQ